MIRTLVIHKVHLVCELTAAALAGEPDIEVVGCTQSAEEGLAKLKNTQIDVAIVSIDLPDNGAFQLTRAITRQHPDTKVLISGLIQSKAVILRCVEGGAAGYILEEDSFPDLVDKIRSVHQEKFKVTPTIGGALIGRLTELKHQIKTVCALTLDDTWEQPESLTPREWEILHYIEQGLTNREIAQVLTIELGTVKNHVHNILTKLNVHSRKHAVITARRLLADEMHAQANIAGLTNASIPTSRAELVPA